MHIEKAFLAVLIMCLVTYLPRMLPITLFRREIKSVFVKSFLQYVPFAVLASLTFPDVLYSTAVGTAVTQDLMIAGLGTLTALVLAYFEKSLVVVAIGTVGTVFAVDLIFMLTTR